MAVNFELRDNIDPFYSLFGPVPRVPVFVSEDDLSKRVRKLDNLDVLFPSNFWEVFLTTNEISEKTFSQLKLLPRRPQSCHIGFSGWHNFDFIVLRHSDYGIVCDCNPASTFFMQKTLALLCQSTTRLEFLEKIQSLIQLHESVGHTREKTASLFKMQFACNARGDDANPYKKCSSLFDEFQVELKRPDSWLSTDENFLFIRKLALEDKIACFTENICNNSTFEKLHQLLQDGGILVDTLYLSNIEQYMHQPEATSAFTRTVAVLKKEETHIIKADKKDGKLSQHLFLGKSVV